MGLLSANPLPSWSVWEPPARAKRELGQHLSVFALLIFSQAQCLPPHSWSVFLCCSQFSRCLPAVLPTSCNRTNKAARLVPTPYTHFSPTLVYV